MSAIAELLRPHVASVPAYVTARSQHRGGILLDANENALGTPVPELGDDLHRYPDPANGALRTALAERTGVRPEALWFGNGSDEAIDLLVRAVAGPGDPVVVPAPSYGVYAQRAAAHGARAREVMLDAEFDLDVDLTAAAARGAKLVFLCSPNNPTGRLLSRDRVLGLLGRVRGLVAVDEAYVDFAGEDASLLRLAGGEGPLERLVVLRTFSKAWGLAGARVGWLAGAPPLVEALSRLGLPYPLSAPAARAATLALDRADLVRERTARLVAERGRLAGALAALGLRVLPSDANFLCFFVPDPGAAQAALAAGHGVIVRNRSGLPGLDGALRVTVGTPAENDRFLDGLREVLGR
ncbi:MAG: histidinol-phosphate transaminase [Gemmatimonadota bacterium]|nr:histidinol-phosphate transaminase [Gemmatimonadota bacterium]